MRTGCRPLPARSSQRAPGGIPEVRRSHWRRHLDRSVGAVPDQDLGRWKCLDRCCDAPEVAGQGARSAERRRIAPSTSGRRGAGPTSGADRRSGPAHHHARQTQTQWWSQLIGESSARQGGRQRPSMACPARCELGRRPAADHVPTRPSQSQGDGPRVDGRPPPGFDDRHGETGLPVSRRKRFGRLRLCEQAFSQKPRV